jgi:hypothetical protein
MACEHWAACGVRGGGCCGLGLYGGRPSLGTCQACPSNTAAGEWPARVTLPILDARAAVCGACDENEGVSREVKGFRVDTVKCRACGCGGLRLADECPAGKWPTSAP